MKTISSYLAHSLGRKSVEIEYRAAGDMDPEGRPQRRYILSDLDELYIVSETGDDDRRGKSSAKQTEEPDIERLKLDARYPLSSLTNLECKTFVGSVAVTAEYRGRPEVLIRGSRACTQEFNNFVRGVKGRLEGKGYREAAASKDGVDRCPQCGRVYPEPERPVCPVCLDKRSLFKRVLALTPRYRRAIIVMVVMMFMGSLLQMMAPYLSGRIFFDEVLEPGGRLEGKIALAVLLIFGSRFLALIFNICHGRLNAGVSARIIYDLKTSVFTAMQHLALEFYDHRQTGVLMTRVNQDAMHLQYFFHDGIPYFIVNLITMVGITGVLFYMDWRLTLLILIPAPLTVFIIRRLQPRLWRLFSQRYKVSARLNSLVNDSLTGARVVKAFGREEREIGRFGERSQDVFHTSLRLGNLNSTFFPLLSLLMGTGMVIIWGVGGWKVIGGTMTFGTLISFTGYMAMFYGPVSYLTHVVEWWSSCMNSAQRIFEIIDSDVTLVIPDDPVHIPEIKGQVEAEGVSFAYEQGEVVLEDVSFAVKPGEMIGLVGHSGAGKTTLTNLIARLYDVDDGRILIDGVDIRRIETNDFRRQVGLVLQQTFLFQGTVLENISYARPEAEPEEIMAAARLANAHGFIIRLPDGYETMLGKGGCDLSGGEKQRLAIARAILHDPRILILDEATASVDTQTEQLIQEALEKLVKGRTTFAIAHRLSTLRQADRLFVFEKGKIVETGTHTELLHKEGVYHRLFTAQREALRVRGVNG